jgi:lipoprotein-releasing system permease protein
LRAKRKEGFISLVSALAVTGIALGVATLIIVMAVMNGFRNELTTKILGFNGHITIYGYERGIPYYDELITNLGPSTDMMSISPIVEGQVMATAERGSAGALVKGMKQEDLKKRSIISDNIVAGSLDDFHGKDSVVLGYHLALALGIEPGDEITLISPTSHATAIGMIPRMKTYVVVALFETGMYEYDRNALYMPLEAAQLLFRYKDMASSIEIMVKDPYRVHDISAKLLTETRHVYRVENWQTVNFNLVNALKIERTVMFFILTLIVAIAAFNIVSSLIMLVNSKAGAIAILRTIGMSKGAILRIFFICGSSLGVVGTCLGLILGISFASNVETIRQFLQSLLGTTLFDPVIYFLSVLPADLSFSDVTSVTLMALGISFIATIYPARKAASLNPAEALRYE